MSDQNGGSDRLARIRRNPFAMAFYFRARRVQWKTQENLLRS